MQSHNLARETVAYENLVNSLAGLQAWNEYQKQQLDNAGSSVATLESKLRGASSAEASALRDMRDVYLERGAILRASLGSTQPLERLLSRWRSSAGNVDTSRSLVTRIADAWVVARVAAKRVWDFEIFSVEDSLETAGGRNILRAGQVFWRPARETHNVKNVSSTAARVLAIHFDPAQ